MTGSDPSGKTDEIDLGGLDLSAGLDLELGGGRPVDVSQPAPAQAETAGAGTVVDLALDLLEPTRVVSPRPGDAGLPPLGDPEGNHGRLEKTVALSRPSVSEEVRSAPLDAAVDSVRPANPLDDGDAFAEVVPVFEPSPRPEEPESVRPAPAVTSAAAAPSPWDELDGLMAKLDRLIASSSPSLKLEAPKVDERSFDSELQIRVEPDDACDAREGLDLAVAFFEMGAFDSARRALTLMRGRDPVRAAQADALLARLALQEGRAHEALRICDLWRSRDDLTEDELLDFRYQSARSLEEMGRFAEAMAEYRGLLARSPSYRDGAIRLSRLEGRS